MISIIVPIYNVENYLAACLDSILNSTYKDIELILVDDGSPDGCGAICDSYAARDCRVRVIHQQNQGVSAARNAGLKTATGDYVAFVDSDDMIHPRMLEVLFDLINSGDYDFSMVHGVMVEENGTGNSFVDDTTTSVEITHPIIITRDKYIRNLGDLGVRAYQYHVIWNKLYRRAFVEGHLFKKMPFEDVEWLNRVNLKLNKGILVEAEMYYYIQRAESTMHTNLNSRKISRINSYYTCLNETPTDLPLCRAFMLKALYSTIFDSRNSSKGTPLHEEVETLSAKIYRETKHELIHSQLSLARKLRILMLYHFPSLYSLLFKLRYGSVSLNRDKH